MTELKIIKEENEKKREFLDSYKNIMKKLCSLDEQQKQIKAEIEQARSPVVTGMPRGGRKRDLSDYIVKLEGLEIKIYDTIKLLKERKLEIQNSIIDVSDGLESEVLRLRYIELWPWENICEEIGYSWKQTHRIHSAALTNFKMT